MRWDYISRPSTGTASLFLSDTMFDFFHRVSNEDLQRQLDELRRKAEEDRDKAAADRLRFQEERRRLEEDRVRLEADFHVRVEQEVNRHIEEKRKAEADLEADFHARVEQEVNRRIEEDRDRLEADRRQFEEAVQPAQVRDIIVCYCVSNGSQLF